MIGELNMEQKLKDYAKWYMKYCKEHADFDGDNDDTIRAFLTAVKEAGFDLNMIVAAIDPPKPGIQTLDDWANARDNAFYNDAIEAGFDEDSVCDWLNRKHDLRPQWHTIEVPKWIIKDIVDYMYHDEQKDYYESGCPKVHIFLAIEHLSVILNNNK
jgi:hypothetical protein